MKKLIWNTMFIAVCCVMFVAQTQAQSPAYGPMPVGQGALMMGPPSYSPHGVPFYDPGVSPAMYDSVMAATYEANGLRYYDSDEPYGGGPGAAGPAMVGDFEQDFDGNCGADCGRGRRKCAAGCGPNCGGHLFDFHAEYMYLKRDTVSRYVPFTSAGLGGPIILDSDDLDFGNPEHGLRMTASFVCSPGYDVEFSYFGTVDKFEDAAQVEIVDGLFSAFSDFGTDPANGFAETDDADKHRIEYSSRINNGEVNFRRRWANPDFRAQGSTIWGFRYVRLDERLRHHSMDGGLLLDYKLDTTNNLYGLQTGGDIFFCVFPGVMLGGEVEAGAYYNHIRNQSNITMTQLAGPVDEEVSDQDVSLVAEASLIAIVELTQKCRLRAAYQLMYLDGVGLAMENFNPNRNYTPANSATPFTAINPFVDADGSVFYHGFNAGFECIW